MRVRPDRIIRMLRKSGGRALILHGRRSVQPVSACGRCGPPVPRRRPAGVHRRLPRLRLPRDVEGHSAGNPRRTGARHHTVRGRGRERRLRQAAVRRTCRKIGAGLQSHEQAARPAGRADAVPAARAWSVVSAGSLSSMDLGRGCPTSARSAPSSMCRAARAGTGQPTTSSGSSARTVATAPNGSSSPTTILPATANGKSL